MKHLLIAAAAAVLVSCSEAVKQQPVETSYSDIPVTKEAPVIDLKTRITNELEFLSKAFDGSAYHGTKDGRMLEIALFGVWRNTIIDAQGDADDEVRKKGLALKKKIQAVQKKEFPLIRKGYCLDAKGLMWEHDINVEVRGSRSDILRFTGGVFASNANIKAFHENVRESLPLMRFKRVEYLWYSGDDEYTYFELKTPADDELVSL